MAMAGAARRLETRGMVVVTMLEVETRGMAVAEKLGMAVVIMVEMEEPGMVMVTILGAAETTSGEHAQDGLHCVAYLEHQRGGNICLHDSIHRRRQLPAQSVTLWLAP